MFQKVKGRSNIALVGVTTDGDVFGGFYSVAVTEQEKYFYDPDIFAFSFESRGRRATPQRFVMDATERLKEWACVRFCKNSSNTGFVSFGVDYTGSFRLGNER